MSLKLFHCYAREDKLLRDTLAKHLGNLRRQELITDWHDRDINAGQEWAKEIDANLNEADIILLLVSPDFIHSDYCYSIEMTRALERHENGTARVIPIILRPCDYIGAPFSKLQALPTDAVPITDRKWRNRDEAFFNVVQGIRKIVGELHCNEWLSKGNECLLRKQYKEALVAFERAIYFNSDNALAYIGKGHALCEIAENPWGNEYEEAIVAFTQAIKLDPSNADAYVEKGTALFMSDAFDNEQKDIILDAYVQALRLNPKHENAYIAQGNALMSYNRNEEALTSFEQAISVAIIPNPNVYKRKGDTLFNLKHYAEALEVYDVCVKAGLRDEELYTNIARAFFNLGNYQKALDAYEKVLAFSNYKGQTYLEKGDTLYKLEKYQESLGAYEKAIPLIPKYNKSSLAQAYRGKGNIWEGFRTRSL